MGDLIRDIRTGEVNPGTSSDYKGIVVDNKDPLKLKRVRCIVEGLFEVDSSKYDTLPWCTPTTGMGGSKSNSGSFSVPEINSIVKVYFPTGDIYAPSYMGYQDDVVDSSIMGLYERNYPNAYGNVDSTGNVTRTDKITKSEESMHSSGIYTSKTPEGTLQLTIPKDLIINVTGDIMINSNGKVGIKAKDILGIQGQAVGLKSSSTLGLEATSGISIEGSSADMNSGIKYGTVDSVMNVLQEKIKEVDKLKSELKTLVDTVQKQGELTSTSAGVFAASLTGTKPEETTQV